MSMLTVHVASLLTLSSAHAPVELSFEPRAGAATRRHDVLRELVAEGLSVSPLDPSGA